MRIPYTIVRFLFLLSACHLGICLTWAQDVQIGMPLGGGPQPLRSDRYSGPLPDGAIARLGSIRFHHPGGIIASAYAPDSKTIVAAGSAEKGHAIRLWDASSGKE